MPIHTPCLTRAFVVMALAGAWPAQAQMFTEPALEALSSADRNDELERIALTRVAAKPDDEQAVLALAVSALDGSDAKKRQRAIAAANACIERAPKAAACQWSLGTVLGVQAMSEGFMKAAGSIGTVKAALTESLLLAPNWWPARSAVVEFHLLAPGIVGGSSAKAREAVQGAPNPEQAKALQARLLVDDKQFEAALAALLMVNPGTDSALASDVRGWGRAAAFTLINDGQPAKARAWFERQLKDRPDDALPAYGMGRVLAETGQPADALALYERSAKGRGAAELPIAYRHGVALQLLGQAEAAKVQLQRFVQAGKGSKNNLDDAKKRLVALGG